MLVGYAQVSTEDQTLDLQKDALNKADCDRILTDMASGANRGKPGLAEAITYLREGDTLVVWKLDRLGRSLEHLIETVTALHERKIGFKSLTENIDTTWDGPARRWNLQPNELIELACRTAGRNLTHAD